MYITNNIRPAHRSSQENYYSEHGFWSRGFYTLACNRHYS